LNQRGSAAKFTENESATELEIRQIIQPNDVVLIMGAGTIDEVARNLVEHE
jgi:UDP-N-acetylmuramate-alanine ligase